MKSYEILQAVFDSLSQQYGYVNFENFTFEGKEYIARTLRGGIADVGLNTKPEDKIATLIIMPSIPSRPELGRVVSIIAGWFKPPSIHSLGKREGVWLFPSLDYLNLTLPYMRVAGKAIALAADLGAKFEADLREDRQVV